MKVLHVIDALGVGGGAEHALATMLPLLRERGIESTVACLIPRDGGLQEELRRQGFDVEVLAARGLAGRARALRRKVRTGSPDLVHATLFNSCLATRLATIGLDVARLDSLVNTSYDPVRVEHLGIPAWKLRIVRGVDGVTARHLGGHFHVLTRAVRDEAVDVLGIDPGRVTVVPRGRSSVSLGARTAYRRREVRERLGFGDGPLLLTVGRQDAQKAQPLLVRAFARVRESHPGAVLLVAGREGDATREIHRTIDELGLRSAVRLLGHRDDAADLYAAADVFVFPSMYEGLGSVIIEAMALATPIIGSDAPAIAEVLDNGRDGAVVPRGNVDALATAMVELLDDADRRSELGRRARAAFEARFELDVVVDATVDLYERVVRRLP
jgi:glycosyltransferase involved in cell wall biosynthesis